MVTKNQFWLVHVSCLFTSGQRTAVSFEVPAANEKDAAKLGVGVARDKLRHLGVIDDLTTSVSSTPVPCPAGWMPFMQ